MESKHVSDCFVIVYSNIFIEPIWKTNSPFSSCCFQWKCNQTSLVSKGRVQNVHKNNSCKTRIRWVARRRCGDILNIWIHFWVFFRTSKFSEVIGENAVIRTSNFQKLQAIEINLGLKIVTIQLAIPLRRVLSANLTNHGITSPYMEILVCCGLRA